MVFQDYMANEINRKLRPFQTEQQEEFSDSELGIRK